KLAELGIDPSPLYRSLLSGRDSFSLQCPEEKWAELKKALEGLCEVKVAGHASQNLEALPLLLSLFLDSLLLFYLLKLSLYSQDFRNLLFSIFTSTRAVLWLQATLSLVFIPLYYYTFIKTRGSPPVAGILGLDTSDRSLWTILFYSLPLPALYLISTGSTPLKVLGLLFLSFCVALSFQLRQSPKVS
ncbi:MAG: hypothetical protein NZM36_05885, partial [Aquificaceae bacterium]|nr:hypothetical protein [Aquificaceae bacterium]